MLTLIETGLEKAFDYNDATTLLKQSIDQMNELNKLSESQCIDQKYFIIGLGAMSFRYMGMKLAENIMSGEIPDKIVDRMKYLGTLYEKLLDVNTRSAVLAEGKEFAIATGGSCNSAALSNVAIVSTFYSMATLNLVSHFVRWFADADIKYILSNPREFVLLIPNTIMNYSNKRLATAWNASKH